MPEPILTAEDLDTIWPTNATSESDYADSIKRVEASKRELRSKRTRVKTLEDALDGYEGQVAEAHKILERGLDGQVSTLKAIGRAGTGNTQWSLSPNFANAVWLIDDHEGPQMLRSRVLAGDYGMSLEGDYKPLIKAHDATLAALRKSEADTKLNAQLEQARRTYENELESIEGDD
jgi:hypothetical protein